MDQFLQSKDRRGVTEARIAEEHARDRLRSNERIDFMGRLDRNGQGILARETRHRFATGQASRTC